MSTPTTWGPPLWNILHIYTEHIGFQTNEMLATDEVRAFVHFLKSVELSMPCAKCRAHYKRWRLSRPIDQFMQFRGAYLRDRVREWIWGLHNDVNLENGHVSPPIETISAIYYAKGRNELHKSIEECTVSFKKAMEHSLLHPEAFHKFRTTLLFLGKFVGLTA